MRGEKENLHRMRRYANEGALCKVVLLISFNLNVISIPRKPRFVFSSLSLLFEHTVITYTVSLSCIFNGWHVTSCNAICYPDSVIIDKSIYLPCEHDSTTSGVRWIVIIVRKKLLSFFLSFLFVINIRISAASRTCGSGTGQGAARADLDEDARLPF